eukprot:scaffold1053_cov332-Pavlova_lutheri.AAC.6
MQDLPPRSRWVSHGRKEAGKVPTLPLSTCPLDRGSIPSFPLDPSIDRSGANRKTSPPFRSPSIPKETDRSKDQREVRDLADDGVDDGPAHVEGKGNGPRRDTRRGKARMPVGNPSGYRPPQQQCDERAQTRRDVDGGRERNTRVRHHKRQTQDAQRIEGQVQDHRHGKVRAIQIGTPTPGLRQIQQTKTNAPATGHRPQGLGQSHEAPRTPVKRNQGRAHRILPSRRRSRRTVRNRIKRGTTYKTRYANRRRSVDPNTRYNPASTAIGTRRCRNPETLGCETRQRSGNEGIGPPRRM